MVAPDRGGSTDGLTTLWLDEDALTALKNVIMTASLYADEMLSGDEQQKQAADSMHDDIDLMCELLSTDLDGLWHEFEQQRKQQFIEYARASQRRDKEQ